MSVIAIFQGIGLLGTVCVIFSYWMVASGKWTGTTRSYFTVNLIGAILLSISLWATPNLGSIVIELFFAAISIYGLIKTKTPPRKS